MKVRNIMTMAMLGVVLVSACRRDDDLPEVPQPVINEPEEITTVELHFTKASDQSEVHFAWSDPDGPGGDEPTVEDIVLDTGETYSVEVEFLDESGDMAEDITAEISEEADEHFICFDLDPTDLADAVAITRTDSDGTYEVGLESDWVTSATASGTLTLTLKHQTGGSKDGTCEPGATDVEVTFNVTIQ